MFTQYEIEEIILGMAKIVRENRALRKENNDLRLKSAREKARNDSFFSKDAALDYEILSNIIDNNNSVESCASNGWLTNMDYIENWELELIRRKTERFKQEESK